MDLFRPHLDQGYAKERKNKAVLMRVDPPIHFKEQVLHQLFNIVSLKSLHPR